MKFVSDRVKNIVATNIFPESFEKASLSRVVKSWDLLVRSFRSHQASYHMIMDP